MRSRTAPKLIAIVNPNNPTGHILTEAEMDAVVAAAERSGAWIVADEVYAGAERGNRPPTPSFPRPARPRDRGQLDEQGLWPARAAHRLDRRAARADRRAVAPARIRDDLGRGAGHGAGRDRAVAGGPAEADRARAAADRPRLRPAAGGAGPGAGRLLASCRREASAMSFVRFDLPVGSRELRAAAARASRACWSCRATASAWTTISASRPPCPRRGSTRGCGG